MKIGFIGTDSGNVFIQTFIDAFLTAQTFLPTEIIIHDQDKQKADLITTLYPGIFSAQHRQELVRESSCFFTCIDHSEYSNLLAEIQPVITPSQVAIFITKSVSLTELEAKLPCKLAKIVPEEDPFETRCYHYQAGSRMNEKEIMWLKQLLSTIGHTPKDDRTSKICITNQYHLNYL